MLHVCFSMERKLKSWRNGSTYLQNKSGMFRYNFYFFTPNCISAVKKKTLEEKFYPPTCCPKILFISTATLQTLTQYKSMTLLCAQIQENSTSDSGWSPSWCSGLRAVKRSEQRPHPTFAPSYVSDKSLRKKCKQAEEAARFGSTTDISLLLLTASLLHSTWMLVYSIPLSSYLQI